MTTQTTDQKFTWTFKEYLEMEDKNLGGCLACGCIDDNCEPDAKHKKCSSCGEFKVTGPAHLINMNGRIDAPEGEILQD